MNLSFTLDEKIFSEISPENLIEKATKSGISSLEISPDTDVLSLKEYREIINIASFRGLELNYHVPYFANDIYELEHFSTYQDKVKEKYLSFFNLLESFQQDLNNNPVIVIHGSNYSENCDSKAMDITLNFLDWVLNIFARKKLPFTIALETLRKKSMRNTLDNRENIFFLLDKFKSDNLKICWDMCHDKLNFYPGTTPIDDNFLNEVVYSHIHGHNLTTDTSHISLHESDLDYSLELDSLSKYNFKGIINIELLSNHFKTTYINNLFRDIDYMSKYV